MSDIRKIQTGNNQYTLHARVADKLAGVATYITRNQINYPWHRIATSGTLTKKSYNDFNVVLCIAEHGEAHGFGIIKINLGQNNSNISTANAIWLLRFKFNIDDIQLGLRNTAGDTCLDVFIKTKSLWQSGVVYKINEGNRNIEKDLYEFITSEEVINTTATDKLTSVEVYKTIEEAATQLHGKAYTSIIKPIDSGTVANAGYAEKIGTGSSHPQIGSSTKPVYVDANGKIQACSRDIPAVDAAINNSSTNPVQNKVINEELSKKADKSQLSSYVTTATANNTYAKKSDISAVYKYKGSVNKVSNLPNPSNLTESNAGDVYNIGTASSGNNITVKSGDNVAWVWDKTKNAGHWDNLSGTVDLSNYLQKGGSQTTTSTEDGGSNVYTFTDGSTITVKNGSKGSTGAAATWFSGGAVTGTSTTAETFPVSGSKAGDMYLNTGTSNVYKATAANQWVYLCNIKGSQGTPGNNGTTPTIKAAAGGNIGAVGTPSVTANTSGTTTTFTFDNLKGQKGDTGATVTWHTGTAVTGTAATVAGVKTGDMYLNTKTYNVYKSTGTNKWVGVCNIKGANGANGTTPTIKAAAGSSINSVGTPTVSATTSGTTTTFTFNNLKGQKGETGATGATVTWHTGTAISKAGIYEITNAKLGDMYLNTTTCDVFRASSQQQAALNWVYVCNIKGAKGDAADIPKLGPAIAGIVPGTRKIEDYPSNPKINSYLWLNGGENGKGQWLTLPVIGAGTSGQARACKDYTSNATNPAGYGHGSTPPTIQPLTSGANDYRGVECDKQGMLFVNVPAYEKNISRAQNTVLAAPTSGAGTATFRKLTTSDIPWNEKFKVMTPAQYKTATKLTNVFYFILEG